MYNQSIRGFIMGAVLGCALWLVAALAMFYMLGYQPRTLPYLWWSLGILTIIAAVQLALTSVWERPAITFQHSRRF